jgi:hypothetical protein
MLVVTTYVWGDRKVVQADSAERLARKLYNLCPWWTYRSAVEIAAKLERGHVVLVPDAEAAFIPGDLELAVAMPVETPGWAPPAGML